MSAGSVSTLYTPAMLSLATELAAFPLSDEFPLTASARSRTCGSKVDIGLCMADDGSIAKIGLKVSACAVGQASAALLARKISGRSPAEIAAARDSISKWLSESGALPDWPGFELIEMAKDSKGRHGALLLPWNAAVEALSMPQASR